MKILTVYIALLMIFGCVTSSYAANWKLFKAEKDGSKKYYDQTNIKKQGDLRYVSMKVVLKNTKFNKSENKYIKETVMDFIYNCKNNTVRNMASTSYTEKGGKLPTIDVSSKTTFASLLPLTTGDLLLKIACKP